ncbi:hypothetical protein AsAng_0055040 [Aureispira anguillae]|uniref:Uncharacterized protein n=1 Tax=Aureispira anguillae TaxID=2864201 RepID=A0A915YKE8_9BACT|nr:hypothetical protein AsAng_0055040 [Aureispira anguillae]
MESIFKCWKEHCFLLQQFFYSFDFNSKASLSALINFMV